MQNDLKNLKDMHRSISLHIGACEVIMRSKTKGSLKKGDLQDILRVEHSECDGVFLRFRFTFFGRLLIMIASIPV